MFIYICELCTLSLSLKYIELNWTETELKYFTIFEHLIKVYHTRRVAFWFHHWEAVSKYEGKFYVLFVLE